MMVKNFGGILEVTHSNRAIGTSYLINYRSELRHTFSKIKNIQDLNNDQIKTFKKRKNRDVDDFTFFTTIDKKYCYGICLAV